MKATALRVGPPALIALLALLAGLSAWVVIPLMQDASGGTDMPAEGWVDGLVPLGIGLLALTCAVWVSPRSSTRVVWPLLPFLVVSAVWTLASGFESGNEILFAACLLGMPMLAIVGGLLSASALRAPSA